MSADVAFESVQEIAVKLARYEELFKHRYTEKDDGYRRIIERRSRWYKVPTMQPWPPRIPYHHRKYEDWDSGHRRGYRHRGRERGWRSRHYHDDHRPPPWRHRSRSPRPDKDPYRERSPHHSPRHRWGYDSPSPHHRPPTPPYRRLSPHRDYYGRRSRSKSRSPGGRPRWRSNSPEGHERGEPKAHEENRGPSGEALKGDTSAGDQAPPTSLLELGLSDSEQRVVPSESDVLAILSSAHTSSNTVTSENLRHVQKVGHHAGGRERGRQRDKLAHSSKVNKTVSLPSSAPSIGLKVPTMHTSSSLLISHGKTENVSSLSVAVSKDVAASVKQAEKEQNSETTSSSGRKKGKKKKPQIVISDESDNEESISVDNKLTLNTASVESATMYEPQTQHFTGDTMAEIGSQKEDDFDPDEEGEIVVDDNESSSLVLHLNRRFYSTMQDSDPAPHSDTNSATYTAVQSDLNATKLIIRSKPSSRTASPLTVDDEREEGRRKGGKKKKKKKLKHSRSQGEGGVKPLQLKITIAKLQQEPCQ